ncbi:unnamed protein product [Amaranthus hypochondriacus]
MEAWLAELEKDLSSVSCLMNDSYNQMPGSTMGVDISYLYSAESDTNKSPLSVWDIDTILMEQVTTPTLNNWDNSGNYDICHKDKDKDKDKNKNNDKIRKQGLSSGAKRKRQPSQVHDHILAERKRRELLSQLFISLSALVPGLKKMDKTSILGEAVKYMKQLKENVKTLEEVVAKRTVQSMVVLNKSQLIIDNDGDDNDSSSTMDDNCASGTSGNNGGDGGGREIYNLNGSLPEIEVKILGNTLLLRLNCENKKAITTKLFAVLDNYNCTVTNSSAMAFETLALDITVVAQIEGDFNKKLKQFMRTLRSALQ